MAVPPPDELEFDEDALEEVADRFVALLGTGGWVNLLPEVEPGHEPGPRNPIASIFSARGDAVPMITWSAPEEGGRRCTLGIEHGSGPRALERLAEVELPLPDGWLKVADHPRRGLVVTCLAASDQHEVLWWLLAAGHVLSTVPLTGSWLARVYEP
jgi:hypothetical protein